MLGAYIDHQSEEDVSIDISTSAKNTSIANNMHQIRETFPMRNQLTLVFC